MIVAIVTVQLILVIVVLWLAVVNHRLKRDNKSLSAVANRSARVEKLEAELAVTTEKLEGCTKALQETNSELSSVRYSYHNLRNLVEKYNRDEESLSRMKTALKGEIDKLEQAKLELRKQVEDLKVERTNIVLQMTEYQRAIEGYAGKLVKLAREDTKKIGSECVCGEILTSETCGNPVCARYVP